MSRLSAQLNIGLSVLFLNLTSVQLCLEALMNGYTAAGNLNRQLDLIARLQNVVRQLNRPDIRTVSALIAKTIGDQNAGLMAVRLIHCFPKSKKQTVGSTNHGGIGTPNATYPKHKSNGYTVRAY